jgi:hypothetical protein
LSDFGGIMREIEGVTFHDFNEVCILIGVDPDSTQINFLSAFECLYSIKEILTFREYIKEEAYTDTVLVDGMVKKTHRSYMDLYDGIIESEDIDAIPSFYEPSKYISINNQAYETYLDGLPKKIKGYFSLPHDHIFKKSAIFFHQDTVIKICQRFGVDGKLKASARFSGTQADISSKQKNSYLRTISALSEALFENGLTGKPHTDAKKILQRLSTRGIDQPVGERALGEYLSEAKKINSD